MATKYLIAGGTGNWSSDTNWSTTSGGANDTTKPVDGDAVICDAASTAITLTVDASSAATSIVFTGFTGTFAGSAALQVKGNITAVVGMTWTYSGTITVANTSGTATLTSAGKTLCGNLTQNGAGGTLTFADAFVTTGTCTLTAGTWNDGNVNLTMDKFSAAGSAVRAITWGTTNTWEITGSGTVFNKGSTTGMTSNAGTRVITTADAVTTLKFSYSGSSSRTIPEAAYYLGKIWISAGSGTFTFPAGSDLVGCRICGLITTGYSGTLDNQGTLPAGGGYIFGSVTLASTTTFTNSGGSDLTISCRQAAGLITIDCAGGTLPGPLFLGIDGAAATVRLSANLACNGAVAFTDIHLGATGTFDANNFGLSCTTFASSGTAARTITMGSGTWTLTSTAATTVWNMAVTTGLTLNANTATIDLTGVTTNVRTITANSVLLPTIKISGGTGAGSVTLTNVNCAGLTFANTYACTGFANQSVTIRGPVTLSNHASFALTAGANAWTLASTSGSNAFTSQGKACDFPITVNGVGGTHTFADAFAHGITRTLTLTNGTVDFGSYTHTMGFFSSSNANVRVIATGTATLNFPTTGTVWDTSTSTNLSITGTGTIALTANSATARTIAGGSALLPSLSMATGSFAPTFTSCNFLSLTITSGYTGTLSNQALTLRGNVSLAATGAVYSAGSNAWTWANTSGTVTWASNGRTLDFPITVNGSATHQLADAMSLGAAKDVTLTAGTLDLASYTATMRAFVSANSNTRVLATGTGTLAVTGTGTVYDTSTSTNLTLTGTGTLKLTANNGTARSITAGSTRLPSLWVSAGTSTTTLTNVTGVIDLNMTGMGAGTIAAGAGAFAIGGSVTFVAAGTWSYTGALTFDATATGKTITSAGKAWTSGTVTFSGSGGGWTLQDAPVTFTSGNALTVAVGHLNTNGFAVTTPALVFSGAGVRELTLGASVVSLTGTGTVLDASGSNQTVNAGTSVVTQTDGTSTLKTMNLGGKTWAAVRGKESGSNRLKLVPAGGACAFAWAA